jgi:hypothetical protein
MPGYIHYTELKPSEPGFTLEREWATYLREVARLLAEGHEGKYVVIKGDDILGMWETQREALSQGTRRIPLGPFLTQQVRTWEPFLRQRITYY